jgi:hypothetical protein
LILDARYEKVREDGVIRSQAVMIAIGVDWEGRRNVLAVELANRESQSSWKEFCLRLKTHGLSGVELVISDDHAGLRKAITGTSIQFAYQIRPPSQTSCLHELSRLPGWKDVSRCRNRNGNRGSVSMACHTGTWSAFGVVVFRRRHRGTSGLPSAEQ